MTLFQYPKSKHARTLAPRQFRRYQTYKRFLQTEFKRVCVYCRQPDSSAPNLNFGVDHYRPKGLSKFAHLVCEYDNLYYCCGSCNSRKSNDWPIDETIGPFVVNPCDYEMASHLRFDSKTGKVSARTFDGQHTIDLLQLNDEEVVSYRLSALQIVRLCQAEIDFLERQRKEVESSFHKSRISQSDYQVALDEIAEELDLARDTLAKQSGELALPPLRKRRAGLVLLP